MTTCFGKEYGMKSKCKGCGRAYQCWIKDEEHGAEAEKKK